MPLTTEGISHQISSAISTYKYDGLGTINDCKVVINHLVRKFSEPLSREGKQIIFRSAKLKSNDKVIKEHLIPVKEIIRHLLKDLDISNKSALATKIKSYLENSLVLVQITKEEDLLLSKSGYQRNMPIEYSDPASELYGDKWARYKCAGIYRNIITT